MRHANLGLVVIALAGCVDLPTPVEPELRPGDPLKTHEDTQQILDWYDYSMTMDMAGFGGTADQSYPAWSGENFSGGAASAYCPMAVVKPEYAVRTLAGNVIRFEANATAMYMHDVPSPNPGYRAARYSLPGGTHSDSVDGQYEARDGTLLGVCRVWRRNILGKTVEGGFMDWYRFDGQVWTRDDPNDGGSGGRGWAYKVISGFQNGAGSGDYQVALNKYLTTGQCTGGWELWVDGAQVCNGAVTN